MEHNTKRKAPERAAGTTGLAGRMVSALAAAKTTATKRTAKKAQKQAPKAAKKSAAKAPAKKTPAKTPAKKSPSAKAPAKKTPAKTPAKKSAAKAPAKKSTTKTVAKKPSSTKTVAKKSTAKKAPGATKSVIKAKASPAPASGKAPRGRTQKTAALSPRHGGAPSDEPATNNHGATTISPPSAQSRTTKRTASKDASAGHDGHGAPSADTSSTRRGATAVVEPPPRPYADDAAFLEEIRQALEAERTTHTAQAADLKAEADSLAEEREPGDVQFDEESGEGGTVTVDRERDLALSAQALAAVQEIDEALARVADGSYGVCERCHEPIAKARLQALPFARLCVACKSGGLSRR